MTRSETALIMAVLQTAYPSYYRGVSKAEADAALNLWAEMFAGDDYGTVEAAVKALIATKTDDWPPTIGAVKEKLLLVTRRQGMSEMEAWGLVFRALRNSLYDSKAEFERLPPDVQRAVGSPNQLREWAMMDSETVQSVVASNFMRGFRTNAVRQRELDLLPPKIRGLVTGLAEKMTMPQLKGGQE